MVFNSRLLLQQPSAAALDKYVTSLLGIILATSRAQHVRKEKDVLGTEQTRPN